LLILKHKMPRLSVCTCDDVPTSSGRMEKRRTWRVWFVRLQEVQELMNEIEKHIK